MGIRSDLLTLAYDMIKKQLVVLFKGLANNNFPI